MIFQGLMILVYLIQLIVDLVIGEVFQGVPTTRIKNSEGPNCGDAVVRTGGHTFVDGENLGHQGRWQITLGGIMEGAGHTPFVPKRPAMVISRKGLLSCTAI